MAAVDDLRGLIVDIGAPEVSIPLIVFRQSGDVPIEVYRHGATCAPLGSDWQDVIEFSVVAGAEASISGWGGEGENEIGLEPGIEYRVRYAVSGADESDGTFDPPYPEHYRLDFWSAPVAPPAIVASASAAGDYWNFQHSARRAGDLVNATVRAEDKFRALVEIAFGEHPELREKIRAGRSEYVHGVLAYTQRIQPRTDFEPDPFGAPDEITRIARQD